MTSLKDLTWESHKKAEKCAFVKKLLKKELTPEQYYVYLSNQATMYWFLEDFASKHKIFDDMPEMRRANRLLEDITEIRKEYGFGYLTSLSTTEKYVHHLRAHRQDKDKLLAHVYVRHLGDLSGGQIIKRFVPVSHIRHYEFDGNVEDIKTRFKQKVSVEHAPEANVCFDFMVDFFADLEAHLDL